MASSRKSRHSARPTHRRATVVLLLAGASVCGWLALSGHVFSFTNGSEFGLVLTSMLLFGGMALSVAAAAAALRGVVGHEPATIADVRKASETAKAEQPRKAA